MIKNFFKCLIFLFFFVFTGCCSVVLREYDVSVEELVKKEDAKKTKNDSHVRIVQISDFHSNDFGKNEEELLSKIKSSKPDVIVLTGDIFEVTMKEPKPLENVSILLSGIRKSFPDCPLYFVSGNHEYLFDDVEDCFEVLEKFDVVQLKNRCEFLSVNGFELIFAGLYDPYDDCDLTKTYRGDKKELYRERVKNVAEKAAGLKTDSSMTILLAHRPEYIFDYLKYDFDLIISGHTHGGVWRLPFINGVYAPSQGFFPKFSGGRYNFFEGELVKKTNAEFDTVMIISRGLSYQRPKVARVLNSPELVIIDLSM